MQRDIDELQRKAKRLRTIEITLQAMVAYLIGLSLMTFFTWAYVVINVVRQAPQLFSLSEPEGILVLLYIQAQTLLFVLGTAAVLYWPARASLMLGSRSYALALLLLLIFLLAQLGLGFIAAGEILERQPWRIYWIAVQALMLAYLIVLLLSALVALRRLSTEERAILRTAERAPLISWRTFKRVVGVPQIVEFMRRRRRRVAAMFFLAACGSAFVPAYFSTVFGQLWFETTVHKMYCEQIDPTPDCMTKLLQKADELQATSAAWLGYLMLIGPLFIAVGVLWLARRRVRISIEELLSTDTRAPVLFLRPFKDDQVVLRAGPQSLFLWLLGLGRIPRTLDEILLEEGTPHGPVVAIGNPSDPMPPYGAARSYFEIEAWQGEVTRLAASATAIMICVDDTEGMWWEVDLIARERHFGKTCFVLHPRFTETDANRRLLTQLTQRLGLPANDLAALETQPGGPPAMMFFYAADGSIAIGRSRCWTRMGVIVAVRWFLRTKGAARAA